MLDKSIIDRINELSEGENNLTNIQDYIDTLDLIDEDQSELDTLLEDLGFAFEDENEDEPENLKNFQKGLDQATPTEVEEAGNATFELDNNEPQIEGEVAHFESKPATIESVFDMFNKLSPEDQQTFLDSIQFEETPSVATEEPQSGNALAKLISSLKF